MPNHPNKMPTKVAEAVVENMTDWVLVVDHKNHKWVYSNPACKRIVGYDANEIIGEDAWTTKLFTEQSRKKIIESWRRLDGEGYLKYMEVDMISKDGREVPVSYSVSAMKNKEGTIVYRIVVIRDVSEVKHMLEDLRIMIEKT